MRAKRASLVTGWMLLLLLSLLLLQIGSACERRPLEDQEEPPLNYASVTVEFDWSAARMEPTGMTALFYPKNGEAPVEHKTGDNVSTVRLRQGIYSIVGFNYSFDEFDALRFRGTDRYQTLEVYAADLEQPDILAATHMDSFEVTEEMVKTRATAHIVLQPVRVVAPGYVTVHLKGLNYIRSAKGVVSGLSESVFLSTGRGSETSCSMPFNLTTPVYYPASTANGTLSGEFTTFGMIPQGAATRSEHRYGFLFSAVLVDKDRTLFEQQFDVTGMIHQSVDVNLNVILRLDLELGKSKNPKDETPTITVPPVEPEAGGAFDVNVGDWGEEENVYL